MCSDNNVFITPTLFLPHPKGEVGLLVKELSPDIRQYLKESCAKSAIYYVYSLVDNMTNAHHV